MVARLLACSGDVPELAPRFGGGLPRRPALLDQRPLAKFDVRADLLGKFVVEPIPSQECPEAPDYRVHLASIDSLGGTPVTTTSPQRDS